MAPPVSVVVVVLMLLLCSQARATMRRLSNRRLNHEEWHTVDDASPPPPSPSPPPPKPPPPSPSPPPPPTDGEGASPPPSPPPAPSEGCTGALGRSRSLVELASAKASALESPRSLAWHPSRRNELWVADGERDSLVVFGAEGSDEARHLKDRGSFHYMANISSLSFDRDGQFATCQVGASSPRVSSPRVSSPRVR